MLNNVTGLQAGKIPVRKQEKILISISHASINLNKGYLKRKLQTFCAENIYLKWTDPNDA